MNDYLNHPKSLIHQQIDLAKNFLKLNKAQRLQFLLTKDNKKNEILENSLELLINGLWRICRATTFSSANTEDLEKLKNWHKKFIIINQLKLDLDNKLNPKLIALNLSLKF